MVVWVMVMELCPDSLRFEDVVGNLGTIRDLHETIRFTRSKVASVGYQTGDVQLGVCMV